MKKSIEYIWEYSKFYGELLLSSNRLHQSNESYAAFLVLFNALELICKSLRESDDGNLVNDVDWLTENGIFAWDEKEFLNGDIGIRRIRNVMTHRDPYAYYFEVDGVMYSFAEKDTWDYVYQRYAPQTIAIICNAIRRKNRQTESG